MMLFTTAFLLMLSAKASLAHTIVSKTKRRTQRLGRCADKLLGCQESSADYDIKSLFQQSVARAAAVEEGKIEDTGAEDLAEKKTGINPLQALQGIFYQAAGNDGPLASMVYYMSDGEGEDLKNVFSILNPAEISDAVIGQWLGKENALLSVAKTLFMQLSPEESIHDLFPKSGSDVPSEPLESTLAELRLVVTKAKKDQKIEKSPEATRGLVKRLLGAIFFLAPRDLADILSLPFFMRGKGQVKADGADESDTNSAGPLLGLPLIVLASRFVLARMFPDLLLSDLVPDLPFINGQSSARCQGQKDYDSFANETMTELKLILEEGGITNTTGVISEDAAIGQNLLNFVQDFFDVETVTVAAFLDDPLITAARLALAAVLTSTGVLSRLTSIQLPTNVDLLAGAAAYLGANITESLPLLTRLAALPLIDIVAQGFPPLARLLDGFDTITTNLLQFVLPDALERMTTVFTEDNFETGGNGFNFGDFLSGIGSGFACTIALASCSAQNLLANALGAELQDGEVGAPVDVIDEQPAENATLPSDLEEEEIKSINAVQTSPSMSVTSCLFSFATMGALSLYLL